MNITTYYCDLCGSSVAQGKLIKFGIFQFSERYSSYNVPQANALITTDLCDTCAKKMRSEVQEVYQARNEALKTARTEREHIEAEAAPAQKLIDLINLIVEERIAAQSR